MEMMERRDLLATRANPDTRLDYVVSMKGVMASAPGAGAEVALRYIPDRRVLDCEAFARYLEVLDAMAWKSLEAMAVAIRDDVNNEVVPRWLQVTVSGSGAGGHDIMLEDSQPKWDNLPLLSRLKRV